MALVCPWCRQLIPTRKALADAHLKTHSPDAELIPKGWVEGVVRLCKMCKRPLDNEEDPFSLDCGGDCIWCMIPIEFDVGNYRGAADLLSRVTERVTEIRRQMGEI